MVYILPGYLNNGGLWVLTFISCKGDIFGWTFLAFKWGFGGNPNLGKPSWGEIRGIFSPWWLPGPWEEVSQPFKGGGDLKSFPLSL